MPTLPPAVAKYAEPVEPICVVLALPRVVRPVTLRVEERVEEAVEIKPGKPRMVEVELPHDWGVHEKVPEPEPQPVQVPDTVKSLVKIPLYSKVEGEDVPM